MGQDGFTALIQGAKMEFVLGSMDPEMIAIAAAVEAAGHSWVSAVAPGKDGVGPVVYANQYVATSPQPSPDQIWVECAPVRGKAELRVLSARIVDHHEVGDPGHGRPNSEAFVASSLGQVLAMLGVEPTTEQVCIGASDHAPVAFLAGECGVRCEEAVAYHARKMGVTSESMAVAVKLIQSHAGAWNSNLCGVSDLRAVTMTPAESKAVYAASVLPGVLPVLNWGQQGIVAGKGRHVGIIGETAGRTDIRAILESIGATGIYGSPGRPWGGYIPI